MSKTWGRQLLEEMQLEHNEKSVNIVSNTTTSAIKGGAGRLMRIIVNTPAAGTVTIYDSATASGTKLGTLTIGATQPPGAIEYDVPFATDLTIVTSAVMDITAVYR